MIKKFGDVFLSFLYQHNITLLISTYEYNQLMVLTVEKGKPKLKLVEHLRPLGIAVNYNHIFVAAFEGIAKYRRCPTEDNTALYVYSGWHHTGLIDLHDICVGPNKLWGINTMFSALCSFSDSFNFSIIWSPSFIDEYKPEDRCHLNSMALWNNAPRFISYFADTNTKYGWKENKRGQVIDLITGDLIWDNINDPHTLRVYQEALYCIESGTGNIYRKLLNSKHFSTVIQLPDYPRGMVFWKNHLIVTTSKLRNQEGCAKMYLIDLTSGTIIDKIEFIDSLTEIYDVQLIPCKKVEIYDRLDERTRTTYVTNDNGETKTKKKRNRRTQILV